MDLLNQLRHRVEQFEVVSVQSEATMIRFESNRLKMSRVEETKGVAVRVVKNGRLGFAASSGACATEQLVENAVQSSIYGEEVSIQFPKLVTEPVVKTFDEAIAHLPIAGLVKVGKEMIDLLLQIEPEARVDVELERGRSCITIQNQAGADVSYQRTPLSVSLTVNYVQDDDILRMSDVSGTTLWGDDHLAGARRLGAKLNMARKLAPMRSGHLAVLFSPTGVVVLGLPVIHGLNGKRVFTGISPMAGKVGEKLFSAKITIADDGTIDGKLGSAPYDSEGVPHRRNSLVENGVLKSFLYDLKTAAQMGVDSTGNGARELFNPPHPAPTNLIFCAGDAPLAEMLAGIEEGLLVENVLGLGHGNVMSGAFSNPLDLGFKIEKGEIVGRVKNISLAGNAYDLLSDVTAVSRETDWVYKNLNLPYILVPEMNVVAQNG